MSTNITNTNNGTSNGASRPKAGAPKSTAAGGGGKSLPFATFPLPEPEVIERLANEFFLSVPRDMSYEDHSSHDAEPDLDSPDFETDTDGGEVPATMLTEDSLPLRQAPAMEPGLSVPASLPSAPPGPLTETDLRAIAASLAGATALVPGTPGTAPTPPAAGSPPEFLATGKTAPLAVAPNLPPATELFSMPGVAAIPSLAPTTPPAGVDLTAVPQAPGNVPVVPGSMPYFVEGEKGASPAAAPTLPPVNDLFSFPRVPAIPNVSGIQTVPNVPAPPLSPSAAPPNVAVSSANPVLAQDAEALSPLLPAASAANVPKSSAVNMPTASMPTANVPTNDPLGSVTAMPETGKSVYPGPTVNLPSPSELFAFPGVPGVQSAPGVPVLPSSAPTDLPEQPASPAVPALSVPDASAASQPGAPANVPAAFEFQPDVVPDLVTAKRPLDPRIIRRDFPILEERVHGKQLIWLDNAATTQKPNAVIDRLSYFYRHENSNIHRAAHTLAARATDAYESAREKSRRFLNASSTREVIFVRGTTEGINLVAQTWGRRNVQKDDEIVITWLEHHANIVPWQMLCSEKGAKLRVAPVNDRGEVILEEYERLLGPRTRIVSFSQVSNALGTITPAKEMVEMAHRYGARVLVDGAQAVSHMGVDVQSLNCDFYVFSGHKVFGPTGIGVVYGKLDVLENMPPWQGGGNMIVDVTFEKTVYQSSPARFEAGTGNIADAVGLGAALDYVEQIGMENIFAYEHELLNYGTAKLLTVPGLRLIGTAREKASVMSFVLDDVRTEDVGVALNQEGIAVRSGHHCAQPILRRMGVESTVRPSLAFYNTCEEIDQLVAALHRIQAGRRRPSSL
jgi:cysteine desulfurase/selenocysteine lyase